MNKIKCTAICDPSNIGCIICMVSNNTKKCPGWIKKPRWMKEKEKTKNND